MMNFDDEYMDGREGHLRIVASAKRKRTSQIFTSDDETSCDDRAPISTLMRSRRDSADEVKEGASRRSLTSAKTKRAGKISDDDETSYEEDSVPISTIKTRYRSKCRTGLQDEVQEDARKRRLTRLRRQSEIKNEQDDKNSFDMKKSVCLQENSSSDDEEDNDALDDEEDSGLEEEKDYDGVRDTEDDDGFQCEVQEDARKRRLTRLRRQSEIKNQQDDKNSFDLKNSVCLQENSSSDDEEDNDALEDKEDSGLEEEEDYDGVQDTEDDDGLEEEEDDDGLWDEVDDDSVEDEGDYDGLDDEEDNDGPEEEEDYDDEQDEEDDEGPEDEEDYDSEQDEEYNDGPANVEFYDGEQEKEDNNSVEEDDDGDSTNKSGNAIIDSEQDMDKCKVRSPNHLSAKTKRVAKIIVSDDEISNDDSSPTNTLGTQHNTRFSTGYEDEVKDDASKQRPTKLTKSESENEQAEESSCASNQTIRLDAHSSSDEEDNDGPEEGPASELDSLDGFIDYSHDEVEHEPIDADDFKAILEQIGRQNVLNVKWNFEADMLADFGKNPELCMRAVCALYRQQTADEKASKETRYRNGRGFSQADALRGCELAKFLTDGDLADDLSKTVEELKQHNPEWIDLCMVLAANYSKQLFQIYQNKEDPYFLPE